MQKLKRWGIYYFRPRSARNNRKVEHHDSPWLVLCTKKYVINDFIWTTQGRTPKKNCLPVPAAAAGWCGVVILRASFATSRPPQSTEAYFQLYPQLAPSRPRERKIENAFNKLLKSISSRSKARYQQQQQHWEKPESLESRSWPGVWVTDYRTTATLRWWPQQLQARSGPSAGWGSIEKFIWRD